MKTFEDKVNGSSDKLESCECEPSKEFKKADYKQNFKSLVEKATGKVKDVFCNIRYEHEHLKEHNRFQEECEYKYHIFVAKTRRLSSQKESVHNFEDEYGRQVTVVYGKDGPIIKTVYSKNNELDDSVVRYEGFVSTNDDGEEQVVYSNIKQIKTKCYSIDSNGEMLSCNQVVSLQGYYRDSEGEYLKVNESMSTDMIEDKTNFSFALDKFNKIEQSFNQTFEAIANTPEK